MDGLFSQVEKGAGSPLGRLGQSCGTRTHLGYLLEFSPMELKGLVCIPQSEPSPQSTLLALSGCFVLGPHFSVVSVTRGAGRWKTSRQTLCSLTAYMTLHLLAAFTLLEWIGWYAQPAG